ncbi:helix-turn-helix domain-containing protein [Geobacter benzoatilyticus]|uniref:Helix-turn-helix transcriptional regulator n=1 Tax=Geobacter benzoatilyticus TaxID=2815309 RepID=A0ABX7Q111_9BACT|nr:helix-turn-helix transcriptional regulator [Geobacter benzoatilyticus]QSV44912.1 helix-turn-helix transcriptional regulator [Geobacter benzoatilyticus]
MKANVIKALMILKGISQTDIAKQLGVKRCTVSGAVNGLRKSRRVQRAIATALDEDYESLWGEPPKSAVL